MLYLPGTPSEAGCGLRDVEELDILEETRALRYVAKQREWDERRWKEKVKRVFGVIFLSERVAESKLLILIAY